MGIIRSLGCGLGILCASTLAGCRADQGTGQLRLLLGTGPHATRHLGSLDGHQFGRWLEVDPDPAARPGLEQACRLEQAGANEEAIAALSESIEDHPACAALFSARGALYVAAGFPRAGQANFQRAVDLAPSCTRSWFALGHACEILLLPRQALVALERAVSLGGEEAQLFLSLARVYRALGRRGQAARYYELALATGEPTGVDLLVEAAMLAREDRGQSAAVMAACAALESCCGVPLADEAWFQRTLLQASPGVRAGELAIEVQALEGAPEKFAGLMRNLLTALQLTDAETRDATRERLLSAEQDAGRRAAL